MTHRGPFQPLLFCDSVILILYDLKEIAISDIQESKMKWCNFQAGEGGKNL